MSASVVNTSARPTGRQIFKVAALLLEIAGLHWPETRADASALIDRLTAESATLRASLPRDDTPF